MELSIDKRLVEKHFSHNAHLYDDNTPVQAEMADKLLTIIKKNKSRLAIRHVLELGCGTGRLTHKILESFPKCKITAVDISPTMLEQSRLTVKNSDRVEYVRGDAEHIVGVPRFNTKFDLICTNATVQWFNNPNRTLSDYRSLLKPGGSLAFSTFGTETFKELKNSLSRAEQLLCIPSETRVMKLLSAREWSKILNTESSVRFLMTSEIHHNYFDNVTTFLRSLKRSGATISYHNYNSPMSRKLLSKLTEIYNEYYCDPSSNKIKVTYEALFGISTLKATHLN